MCSEEALVPISVQFLFIAISYFKLTNVLREHGRKHCYGFIFLAHTHKSKIPVERLFYCLDIYFLRFFIRKSGSRTLEGRNLIYRQAQSYIAHSQIPNPTRFKAVQKWHFDLVCSQGGPDCASSAFRGSHALDGQPAQKAAARSKLKNFLSASRCTSFRKRMGSVDGWRWPAVPRGWMESTGSAQSQRSHLQREVLSSKKNCWEVWEGILTTATPRKKPLSLINYSRPAAPARQPDMRLPCKTSLQMQSRCSSHCQGRHL